MRHFRNRDAEVLFPQGDRGFFSKKDMTWVITNNKGCRVAKKSGVEWDLEPIPCAYETDSVTNARMMIRDDKVMTIEFADGSLFCQHADGTLMMTSADGLSIRVEKEGYAPVIFNMGSDFSENPTYPHRNQVSDADCVTAERRAQNSLIIETHLPDGTVIDTFLDIETGYKHIFNRPDFSVLSVNG